MAFSPQDVVVARYDTLQNKTPDGGIGWWLAIASVNRMFVVEITQDIDNYNTPQIKYVHKIHQERSIRYLRHWHMATNNWNVNLSWWRHQMETFSALLAICAGNSPVPGEFPAQKPVTRSFDGFFDLHPNKRLSKQWWGWWFETLSWPLWRHRNVKK